MTGFIYSILSALCFGTLAIFGKIGLDMGFAPLEIVQVRFALGAVMLFVWTGLTHRERLRIRPRALMKAAVLGCLIYPCQSWMFMSSLQTLPAATTSLIFYLYPLVTTLIAMAVLGLRPGRSVFAALFLIALGCGLVFYNAFARNLEPVGMIHALGCMFCFSIYLTLVEIFSRGEDNQTMGLYVILFAAIAFCVLSSPARLLTLSPSQLVFGFGLALIPTVLAITLLYKAIDSVGSAYAAIFSSIEPVTTVLLAAFVLQEDLHLIQIGGMLFIVLGIILPNAGLIRKMAHLKSLR